MLKKFEPMDIIAIIVIIGCFGLIWFQRDGFISAILTMVVGYYFGKKSSTMPQAISNAIQNERTNTTNN